jgi:two-component system cell cycle sensor histidine kinase/response regulator CckA
MPGMNGSDLAEQLKLMDPTLKTIYMSGYTSTPVMHKGFSDPRIAYLQKPFTLKALGQKVKQVLSESEPTA